jgi:hypothetical protein
MGGPFVLLTSNGVSEANQRLEWTSVDVAHEVNTIVLRQGRE